MKSLFILLFSITYLSSCSTMNKLSVNMASPLLFDLSYSIEFQRDFEFFRQATPSNLQLFESIWSMSPKNEKLLSVLVKGYAGFAFAVFETEYLSNIIKAEEDQSKIDRIIHYYTKAFNYALMYFSEHNISYRNIVAAGKEPGGVKKLFDKELDDEAQDLEIVLFAAQSLGSMINLQKTNMGIVAQLPTVKEMFDWVCEKNPKINFGACDIFYATFEASRPKTLGGDPEKGKKLFLEGIKNYPDNFLIRAAYIQYYIVPMSDEEGYKEQRFYLEAALRNSEKFRKWSPIENDFPEFKERRLAAYQMVGLERFKIFKKYEKELF